MEKKEMREIAVNYCDFCGEETPHLLRCGVCKKEMCPKDGGAAHAAYGVEIYQYGVGNRSASRVCKECCQKGCSLSIGELISRMMDKDAVIPLTETPYGQNCKRCVAEAGMAWAPTYDSDLCACICPKKLSTTYTCERTGKKVHSIGHD